ncbi:MAG: NUDIX hydrolase [Verrucomicrobiota bacterium]
MSEDAKNQPPRQWEHLGSENVARCRVFDVERQTFRHPARGSEADFYVINARNWCNVLPLTPDGRLILVRQFRFGVRELCWETPGGIMDGDEHPVDTAIRELAEETGYVGNNARVIGACRPNPAILNNFCHYVRIDNCELKRPQNWDEHEEIELTTLPVEEAIDWARSGRIVHAMAINALFYLQASMR